MRADWIALVWRLPTGSSTPRVTTWRALKRLGAASLTPGAAIVPYREDLLEQMGWLAQEIEEMGGDAWVLPVTELSEAEEAGMRAQVNHDREAEYSELAKQAAALGAQGSADSPTNREFGALRRRLDRIRARDYFGAAGGAEASRAVEASLTARMAEKVSANRD
jgi:hypothetical protein